MSACFGGERGDGEVEGAADVVVLVEVLGNELLLDALIESFSIDQGFHNLAEESVGKVEIIADGPHVGCIFFHKAHEQS